MESLFGASYCAKCLVWISLVVRTLTSLLEDEETKAQRDQVICPHLTAKSTCDEPQQVPFPGLDQALQGPF